MLEGLKLICWCFALIATSNQYENPVNRIAGGVFPR